MTGKKILSIKSNTITQLKKLTVGLVGIAGGTFGTFGNFVCEATCVSFDSFLCLANSSALWN